MSHGQRPDLRTDHRGPRDERGGGETISLREITFPPASGRDTVQGRPSSPAAPPRAVVQIVHGLGEHARRDLHLASMLLEAGSAIVADDHTGHDRTAMESGIWGDAGSTASRGRT